MSVALLAVSKGLLGLNELPVLLVGAKQPVPPQEGAGVVTSEVLMVEIMKTCPCMIFEEKNVRLVDIEAKCF